jgi:hypothetical protein
MTDPEVEPLVLDVVRRYTQNESAAADSDFKKDLRLSDAARQMLFASLAQAFAARGANLPSYRFYLTDFLTCPTPAAVRDAIRAKVFKVSAPKPAAAPVASEPVPGRARKPAARRKAAAKKSPARSKAVPRKKAAGTAKAKTRHGKR